NGGGFAAQPEEQTEEGIYRVDFDALNTKMPDGTEIHNLEGNLIIRIEGDQVNVVMGARNAPSGTHRAHVHTGRNCPTMANDANGDGFVDFVEAAGVTGPALIPLDGNLDSQEEGSGNNPSGSTIAYSESTTLSEMMADLQAPDPNPEDGLAK